MPSPWYILAAVAYVGFIVLCCLVVAIAEDDETRHAIVSLCDRILESEGDQR